MGESGLPSMLTIWLLMVWAIMPQPTAQYGQTVGTDLAFWMRSTRACATEGARLTPSAPSVPSAAETPPESLMKSRRERPLGGLEWASSMLGMTGAVMRTELLLEPSSPVHRRAS